METEKTLDLFDTEIKIGDLIIVTAFQGRNPETMVGRVTNVSTKTTESYRGPGHFWTSHTVSFFKIDNPELYSEYGRKECGRIVKSGNPDRIVVANEMVKAVNFAAQYEVICREIQAEVKEQKRLQKEEDKAEKAHEMHLADLKQKREAKKVAERKAILAKLTPAERKILKACAT